MDTKLSEFCLKYEIFTGRVFRMTLKLSHGIYDSTHNLKRKLSCSVPWNWCNLMELGVYLKGHFGGKTSLNPKPFLINTIQNGLEHKKLMVIEICSVICHVIFDFDNLTIPYLVVWEIFGTR